MADGTSQLVDRVLPVGADDRQWTLSFPRWLRVRLLRDPARVSTVPVKNILEPIFEADFYPTSYGFRPGRSVHGALEHLRMLLLPRDRR